MKSEEAKALMAVAEALTKVAVAIEHLGTNEAHTRMGAIELLAKETRDGFERLSEAVMTVVP